MSRPHSARTWSIFSWVRYWFRSRTRSGEPGIIRNRMKLSSDDREDREDRLGGLAGEVAAAHRRRVATRPAGQATRVGPKGRWPPMRAVLVTRPSAAAAAAASAGDEPRRADDHDQRPRPQPGERAVPTDPASLPPVGVGVGTGGGRGRRPPATHPARTLAPRGWRRRRHGLRVGQLRVARACCT